MYDPINDIPALAKTGDLNEDLGQIEYLFSDKTGTLTENKMEFRMALIGNKVYGFIPSDLNQPVQLVENYQGFQFYDSQLLQDLGEVQIVKDFIEVMSLCHTIITENSGEDVKYQASSPDEEALVVAARCFGYKFVSARQNKYVVKKGDQIEEFQVVGVNEFSSDRKRMSIVVINQKNEG